MARTRRRSHRSAPTPEPASPARRPWWRDPWGLVLVAAVASLAFACRSTPAGEPFSDDFWFLHFSVLRGNPSWLDGGGGAYYWRPLARQAYYALLGPLMLSSPGVVAAFHVAVFAAAGFLAWRALARDWPSPAAVAAGAFPLLMEASRSLVAWPSGAQDLGALVLLALALHAVARGRPALAALAAVAAALCKEVAAPLALLAAFAPFAPRDGARRTRVTVVVAIAAWGAARVLVQAGVFGPGPGPPPLANGTPLPAALMHAAAEGALDAFGAGGSGRLRFAGTVVMGALALVSGVAWVTRRDGTRPWRWAAFGLAWFAAGVAPLALLWPDWAPFRSVVPALGLGIALAAPLEGHAAAWVLPLVGARLVLLLAAPGASPGTSLNPPENRIAMDFEHLSRLQRFMREARVTMRAAHPDLPHGARVVRMGLPRGMVYGLGEDRALQLWYRDSTLRFVPVSAYERDPRDTVDAVLEFELNRRREITSPSPVALWHLMRGRRALVGGRWAEGWDEYQAAESLVADTAAYALRAECAGGRSFALLRENRAAEAVEEAQRSLALNPHEITSRLVLGEVAYSEQRWSLALRIALSVLRDVPSQASAIELRDLSRRQLGLAGR